MNPAGFKRIAGSLVLTIVAIAFIVVAMGRFSGRGGGPPRRPPIIIRVGVDSSVALPPAQFHEFEFRLPPRLCTLTGRIMGGAGDRPHFEALVLDDDGFRKWVAKREPGPVHSGRMTDWSPSVTLVGPGRRHLVINNLASPPSVETVRVDGKVTCL